MLTLVLAALLALPVAAFAAAAPPAVSPADLAGAWTGSLAHDGDSTAIGFGFAPDTTGRVMIEYTLPALHFDRVPLGAPKFVAQGDSVRIGPFRFAFDRGHDLLSGTMPAVFFPAYDVRVTLHRGAVPAAPARPVPPASVTPRWTFDGGSPMWAGPAFADGRVYVGTQSGKVFALDGRTGAKLWEFTAGGAVRCRPACAGGAVYVAADDGVLYRLASATGKLAWQVKLVQQPVARLPASDPNSKFDRFGSDVTVAGGALYVGTPDGRLVALAAADGRVAWEFRAGDAVLAAPAVGGGRVVFGSYDHFVYSLDAADGHLVWKCDTRGRVVSTPALAGNRIVIGNRIYDLLGLDARTGEVAWRRYQWGTWVESSAAHRDGIAYVGSSDGACVSAWQPEAGKRLWLADVGGWSWGQPAVTAGRVYAGVSGQVGYPIDNRGALVALDRESGAVAWRFAAQAPPSGDWGFAGSPAVGTDLVYAGGLDGKLYAFAR
jgi:outer membrane protein assembly factor BamB